MAASWRGIVLATAQPLLGCLEEAAWLCSIFIGPIGLSQSSSSIFSFLDPLLNVFKSLRSQFLSGGLERTA